MRLIVGVFAVLLLFAACGVHSSHSSSSNVVDNKDGSSTTTFTSDYGTTTCTVSADYRNTVCDDK